MNWIIRALGVVLVVCSLNHSLLGGEYEGAVIARGYPERLAFHYEGKARVLPFGLGLKYFDMDGKELTLLEGAGILTRGNKVTLTTIEGDSPKDEQVIAVRLLEGKLDIPEPEISVDLNPDPNFKDPVEKGTMPDDWIAYLPTAKVGDYAVYKGFGHYRLEVLAVDGSDLTVARVVDTRGTRHEFRTKYTLSKEQQDRLNKPSAPERSPTTTRKTAASTKKKTTKPAKNLTAAQKKAQKEKEAREAAKEAERAKEESATQPMVIDGRQLVCSVQKINPEHTRWHSTEVPFSGFVMIQRPNENEQLVAFGRGKK